MIALEDVDAIVDQAAALMDRELGLRPDPAMLSRLRRCLRDGAAEGDLQPAAYLDTLVADRAARQHLFDRLTVQETSFFRHAGQFDALANHVLPGLAGPVTIWSAGCANGQEAYSLAMVLDESGIPGSVIATDVSMRALQRTGDARYQTRELTGLSEARRSRYVVGGPDEWELRPAIRDRVTVRHHNLVTDALPDHLAHCQVVFCRNVLIYFSPEHAKAFLTRLAGQLDPGASLFLGYAETIWQVSDLFHAVRVGDAFEYFRRGDPAAMGRPAPAKRVPTPVPVGPAGRARRRAASAPGRPRRAPPVAPSRSPSPAGSAQQGSDLARIGQAAAAERDYPAAIAAFRKCVYLAPDAPMGHVHLGLALEAAGDRISAHRAFDAARAALSQSDATTVVAELGGYRVEELLGLLDDRQEHP